MVACSAQAREAGAAGSGHIDLSVTVADDGSTIAAILHNTISDHAISECVARALSGAALPSEGKSYRIRVRVEAGG